MGDDFNFHEAKHEQMFANYSAYVIMKAGTYHIQNYTYKIEETISIALQNDSEHDVKINSRCDNGVFTIEVIKDGEQLEYEFEGVKEQTAKKGWFF